MPQIRMVTGYPATKLFHFWCDAYAPLRIYYPDRKYIKGACLCKGCAIKRKGIMYWTGFTCTRERTSKPTTDQLKEMFGWMYGKETKRTPKSKVARKSKKSDDRHETNIRISIGTAEEKSESAKERVPAPEIKPGETGTSGNPDGLPQLPQEPMWVIAPDVSGTITDSTLQEMWIEGDLQSDKRTLGVLPGVQTMKDEFDESYELTTMHACITCSCGRKVWYGCGEKQETRPKYCKECTKKVILRLENMKERLLQTMGVGEFDMLVVRETRRYLR